MALPREHVVARIRSLCERYRIPDVLWVPIVLDVVESAYFADSVKRHKMAYHSNPTAYINCARVCPSEVLNVFVLDKSEVFYEPIRTLHHTRELPEEYYTFKTFYETCMAHHQDLKRAKIRRLSSGSDL